MERGADMVLGDAIEALSALDAVALERIAVEAERLLGDGARAIPADSAAQHATFAALLGSTQESLRVLQGLQAGRAAAPEGTIPWAR